MNAALALGAAFGLLAMAALRMLRPAPPPLAAALRRLNAPADVSPSADTVTGRWVAASSLAAAHSIPAADLQIVGRTPADHVAAKVTGAVLGVLFAPALAAIYALMDAPVLPGVVFVAAVLFAMAGFFLPDMRVRRAAAERRAEFTVALGSWLDLVVIGLAGGAGVEGSVRDAARVGNGWAFNRLRASLELAQMARVSPWDTLGRLGAEIGVIALVEVAATVGLAGTEGARVRESLIAKAAAVRQRQLSEAEAEAQAATERMTAPTVLLLVGFLMFLGYPAMHTILSTM